MTSLAAYEPQPLAPIAYEDPEEIVIRATKWATHLMKIVEQQGMSTNIDGKQYLEVEGWQTIGAFPNASAVVEYCQPFLSGDGLTQLGYNAKVNIMQGGVVVSSGIMPCGYDDFPCRGKEGMAKEKACMSAAQTWAESKAYRMKFAFVAKLAGFEPTPADEMKRDAPNKTRGGATSSASTQGANYGTCQVHNQPWIMNRFKKLCHKDGAGWCNYENVVPQGPEPEHPAYEEPSYDGQGEPEDDRQEGLPF